MRALQRSDFRLQYRHEALAFSGFCLIFPKYCGNFPVLRQMDLETGSHRTTSTAILRPE